MPRARTVAFELARSAWMAQSLRSTELTARNAQMSAATSVSEVAAFALGGWLYEALGAVAALVVDALSYVVSAAFVRRVREAPVRTTLADPCSMHSRIAQAGAGIAMVATHPALRSLARVEVLARLATSVAGTSYMIFVARDIGFATGILGMIFAVGGTLYDAHDRTLRQTSVRSEVLVRADAGIRTLGQLATLIGAVAGGALASARGTRLALVVSAALLASAAMVVLPRALASRMRSHGIS
jgi:hypothetical protein